MYLQDYLSPAEIEYLIDLADPYYQQSPVVRTYLRIILFELIHSHAFLQNVH